MGFISYLVFIIIAMGFVGYVNHRGEWFIMDILRVVVALIFGLILGIIMGLVISDC